MHLNLLVPLLLLAAPAADVPVPETRDARLQIKLFAADPDLVTPCGLAVDPDGRVFVVESHTHFRPGNYPGPKADRIRCFQDTDGDGTADAISTFYEGTTWTMNVGVHPDGSLYVATRSEIFRLRDTDGDGTADERTPIVRLEPAGNYPHNGLSGFAFDFAGNVYFGLGENLGANFELIGTDGSVASDLEGGQVYRCTADGGHVEMLAFGFWNPFHVAFDAFGRLFAVDNDPDSLPPCRLIHVVPGGNYGYRYRNGRKGVHPFTAWNGELPGTLPMVAGTGEAPSGVVAYESDHLPADYRGDLLVTSWGDHRLERYRLEPRGASFRAETEIIVQGDEDFRPVGIAVAPDGSLFVSDWVKRDYELHGKGRLWHVTARDPAKQLRPEAPGEAVHSADRQVRERAARELAADESGRQQLAKLAGEDSDARVRAVALAALHGSGNDEAVLRAARGDSSLDVRTAALRLLEDTSRLTPLVAASQPPEVRAETMRRTLDAASGATLWESVSDADAFVAEAAREGLRRLHAVTAEVDLAALPADQRLACLLILRESRDPAGAQLLPKFLSDPDVAVRFAAVQWVGEERLAELREPLVEALSAGPATARLFGGYLSALERLDGKRRQSGDEWAGQQYMAKALEDARTSPEVRRFALRMLAPDHPVLSLARLKEYLAGDDSALQLEAVRTLRDSPHAERAELLRQIAAEASLAPNLRAEAIVGLLPDDAASRQLLVDLATGDEPILRGEALRSLRGCELNDGEREQLAAIDCSQSATAQLVERVLNNKPAAASAGDVAAWLSQLRGEQEHIEGDPQAGARVFFHRNGAGCVRCHQVAGRGAKIGPELTATAAALAEERLVESIVRPGQEIAPQFVTWLVQTADGRSLVGMLVHQEPTGEQTYADQQGTLTTFKPGEIESRRPQPNSIMPDNLPAQLTVQEFRDLVAFLRSQ